MAPPLYNDITASVNAALQKVKHLSSKTKNILKYNGPSTTDYTDKINKKNYILTSQNHLAAMLIKTMLVYVDTNYNKEGKGKTKTERLIKLINRLKDGSFELKTARNILEKLDIDKSKFGTLLLKENSKDFKKICDKAKGILANVNLENPNEMSKKEFDESEYVGQSEEEQQEQKFVKSIIEKDRRITEMAKGKGINETLRPSDKNDLKPILNQIISMCETGFETIDKLKSSISKQLAYLNNLDSEKNYLDSVIKHLPNTGKKPLQLAQERTDEDNKLNACHKDAVRLLCKTKLAIDEAYNRLDNADAETTSSSPSPSSSSFESSSDGKTEKSSSSSAPPDSATTPKGAKHTPHPGPLPPIPSGKKGTQKEDDQPPAPPTSSSSSASGKPEHASTQRASNATMYGRRANRLGNQRAQKPTPPDDPPSAKPPAPATATGRTLPKDPPPKAPTKASGQTTPTKDTRPAPNPRPKTGSGSPLNARKTATQTTSAVPPARRRTPPTRKQPNHTNAKKVPPPPNRPAPAPPSLSAQKPPANPNTAEQNLDIPPDMPELKPINIPNASQTKIQVTATRRKASGPKSNTNERTRTPIPTQELPPTPVTPTKHQSSDQPAPKQVGNTGATTKPGGEKPTRRQSTTSTKRPPMPLPRPRQDGNDDDE